ncbi:MAG: DUF2179 domain-containing protein [Bacteroidales bacterium]
MEAAFPDSYWFVWFVLPLLIFFSRVLDVSIGTIRLIFVSKGYKYLAPVLGFFEVIIWLLAIGQIMQHLTNVACYIAYGAGFAAGNYVGIVLEEKLSMGKVLVRVIPRRDITDLVNHLRHDGFAVTTFPANGMSGPVEVVLSIINRKTLAEYVSIVHQYNPHAFYTVEDVMAVSEGYLKPAGGLSPFSHLKFLRRKGK